MGELSIVEQFENQMLDMEQVNCDVSHYFGPNIYIREVHLPAGTLAVGHKQKFTHMNVMIKGKVVMPADNGEVKILEAPLIFNSPPGRKFGYVLEDTVWQNIYSTDETDIDKLEAHYLDKSYSWQEYEENRVNLLKALYREDIKDYENLLEELNLTEEDVQKQVLNKEDYVEISNDLAPKITIRDSYIQGKGAFLSSSCDENEILAVAKLGEKRTLAGRYVNHSKNPNCRYTKFEDGNIYLVSNQKITGCSGGQKGEELTVNYREARLLVNRG